MHFGSPAGVSGTAGYKGLGTASLGHECPTVPQRKPAGHLPAHLLLQTDAKLLGGQRGPRRRHLGRRGRPALAQVPELLIVPEDTAEARLSPCRGRTPRECLQDPCLILLGPGTVPPAHACVCVHVHTRMHTHCPPRPWVFTPKAQRIIKPRQMPTLSAQPRANIAPVCLHKGFPPSAGNTLRRSLDPATGPWETHFFP